MNRRSPLDSVLPRLITLGFHRKNSNYSFAGSLNPPFPATSSAIAHLYPCRRRLPLLSGVVHDKLAVLSGGVDEIELIVGLNILLTIGTLQSDTGLQVMD
ncbi:hypothetical protein K1719_017663 [Acacia pycnantha]|nr:hypothetical protein K1719_017663 [Acacia pycnantha]